MQKLPRTNRPEKQFFYGLYGGSSDNIKNNKIISQLFGSSTNSFRV
jgi:hypothetical protein